LLIKTITAQFLNFMFNPPHPGLTLRDDVLVTLNLQVGEAAAQLGIDLS
jgi:plasmid maintenance system antidote protein VapI